MCIYYLLVVEWNRNRRGKSSMYESLSRT